MKRITEANSAPTTQRHHHQSQTSLSDLSPDATITPFNQEIVFKPQVKLRYYFSYKESI